MLKKTERIGKTLSLLMVYNPPRMTAEIFFLSLRMIFSIKCSSVTIVQRLLPHNREGSTVEPSSCHPPPVIFMVSFFALIKQILPKNLLRRKVKYNLELMCQGEDFAGHKTLLEELKGRTATGEINLAIYDFQMVSKNGPSQREASNPSQCPCSSKVA